MGPNDKTFVKTGGLEDKIKMDFTQIVSVHSVPCQISDFYKSNVEPSVSATIILVI
jgi:hypothetical protein